MTAESFPPAEPEKRGAARQPKGVSIAIFGLLMLLFLGVMFREEIQLRLFGVPPAGDPAVGTQAAPFTATTMDGETVRFPDDFAGQVVLLEFWATWCSPCIAQVPYLRATHERFAGQGFEIFGISLDAPQTSGERVAQFLTKRELGWPQVYRDSGAIANAYGVQAIPTAYLVDGDTGEIIAAGEQVHGPFLEVTVAEALERRGVPDAPLAAAATPAAN
jgi:peroxiredoxin